MIDPTEPPFEMTGAVRNEMLRRAKTKAEKRAIHLAYEERQCRLRIEKANVLLEKMRSGSGTGGVEDCAVEGLTCRLLSYRKGTAKVHLRVRTGIEILGRTRKATVLDRDDV
jgi:hypothetical protein